jgi:heme/copper-type cytochrome/quinol oxidase subunit 2
MKDIKLLSSIHSCIPGISRKGLNNNMNLKNFLEAHQLKDNVIKFTGDLGSCLVSYDYWFLSGFYLLKDLVEIQKEPIEIINFGVVNIFLYTKFFLNQTSNAPMSVIKDSYLVSVNDSKFGDLRLLRTDFPLLLPQNTHIRILISSTDVLHSWSIPAFGIKVDAVPGRLNQISLFSKSQGIFYGQCSELCGINHAFMPIEVYISDSATFYKILFFLIRSKII